MIGAAIIAVLVVVVCSMMVYDQVLYFTRRNRK